MAHERIWLDESSSMKQWMENTFIKINEIRKKNLKLAYQRIESSYENIAKLVCALPSHAQELVIQDSSSFRLEDGRKVILFPNEKPWDKTYEIIFKLEYTFICHMHRVVRIDKGSSQPNKLQAIDWLDQYIKSDNQVSLKISENRISTVDPLLRKALSQKFFRFKAYLLQRINNLYDRLEGLNLDCRLEQLHLQLCNQDRPEEYSSLVELIYKTCEAPFDESASKKNVKSRCKQFLHDNGLILNKSYGSYLYFICAWGWRYILLLLGCSIYYDQAMLVHNGVETVNFVSIPELMLDHDLIFTNYSHDQCWVPKCFLGQHYVDDARLAFQQQLYRTK